MDGQDLGDQAIAPVPPIPQASLGVLHFPGRVTVVRTKTPLMLLVEKEEGQPQLGIRYPRVVLMPGEMIEIKPALEERI